MKGRLANAPLRGRLYPVGAYTVNAITTTSLQLAAATRRRLLRRGLRLECLTLGWNVVGSVLVLVAAAAARSVALCGT